MLLTCELDLLGRVLGKEHADTLTSVSNLAVVLRDQGKYEAAEEMDRRALEGKKKGASSSGFGNSAPCFGERESSVRHTTPQPNLSHCATPGRISQDPVVGCWWRMFTIQCPFSPHDYLS
jgi:hypothetical protein